MRWLERLRRALIPGAARHDPAAIADKRADTEARAGLAGQAVAPPGGTTQADGNADATAAALAAFRAGHYEAALALWGPQAQAGDPRAQTNIGTCFAQGFGVEADAVLALRWLTLSAEAGYAPGQRNLADFLLRGASGMEPDPTRAAVLYREAAEGGDPLAQDMLSWMLLEGETLPADPAEARRWATLAAEAGIAASMTRLGLLFHHAMGVERDVVAAARWWREAAARGDADGQAMLGAALSLGAGVAMDGVEALHWLLRGQHGGSKLARPFLAPARAALDEAGQAEAGRRAALPLEEVSAAAMTSGEATVRRTGRQDDGGAGPAQGDGAHLAVVRQSVARDDVLRSLGLSGARVPGNVGQGGAVRGGTAFGDGAVDPGFRNGADPASQVFGARAADRNGDNDRAGSSQHGAPGTAATSSRATGRNGQR